MVRLGNTPEIIMFLRLPKRSWLQPHVRSLPDTARAQTILNRRKRVENTQTLAASSFDWCQKTDTPTDRPQALTSQRKPIQTAHPHACVGDSFSELSKRVEGPLDCHI